MKAFLINKYTKEGLQLVDVSKPKIKDNEVLIEIYALGLNLLDSKIKTGEFKLILPYKMPLILRHDLAGIVIEVGENVKSIKLEMKFTLDLPIFISGLLQNILQLEGKIWLLNRRTFRWRKHLRFLWSL